MDKLNCRIYLIIQKKNISFLYIMTQQIGNVKYKLAKKNYFIYEEIKITKNNIKNKKKISRILLNIIKYHERLNNYSKRKHHQKKKKQKKNNLNI